MNHDQYAQAMEALVAPEGTALVINECSVCNDDLNVFVALQGASPWQTRKIIDNALDAICRRCEMALIRRQMGRDSIATSWNTHKAFLSACNVSQADLVATVTYQSGDNPPIMCLEK